MKKILGRLIIVAPAVIIQILWMNFLYNKLNNSALVTLLLTILAFLFVIYIINKRDETSYKILWLITILTAPVFGTILYLIIGNKKTTKPLDKKLKRAQNTMNFNFVDERNYGTELKQENLRLYQTFKAINKYTKFPIYKAENIKYYKLGDEMFPDILEELKKAQKYIFLEYFIIEPGIFLNSIIDILEQKVKDGVDVRLIYDDFGSLPTFSQKNVYQLKTRGIKCISFNPLFFIKGTLNNRDHRKILIIDGNVAFSGGINLADEYINKKKKYGHWKDIGFKLMGTPVKSYNYMFIEFWNAFSNEKIDSNIINECLSERKNENGYIISYYDSPAYKEHISNNLYIDLLSQAINYAWFYTPYLIIGDFLMDALIKAAERGVDVRIFIPGIPDKKIVYRLSKSYYAPLLKAGIKIFEYTPGFIHAKACLIDDNIGTIGTVNLDYRSLFLHFECNSLFYKSSILDELKIDMIETQKKCKEVKEKDIKKGYFHRVFDAILRIFAPLC